MNTNWIIGEGEPAKFRRHESQKSVDGRLKSLRQKVNAKIKNGPEIPGPFSFEVDVQT